MRIICDDEEQKFQEGVFGEQVLQKQSFGPILLVATTENTSTLQIAQNYDQSNDIRQLRSQFYVKVIEKQKISLILRKMECSNT